MSEFVEFPKWLHAAGRKSVLVEDAEGEAAVFARWAALDAPPARKPDPTSNVVNLLVGSQQPQPKARGGWPKGKPRAKKATA